MLENAGSLSMMAVLTIGLVFGLKHATEVDHVVAISTIVSRHKNIYRGRALGRRSHGIVTDCRSDRVEFACGDSRKSEWLAGVWCRDHDHMPGH